VTTIAESSTPVTRTESLRQILSEAERRTLSAAVRRVVLDAPDDLSARVEDRIAGLLPHKIAEARSGLRLFGGVAAALVSVRRATAFYALSAPLQDQMLNAWGESPLPQARTLFQLLRRLALVTHYADPRSHAAIGYRGSLFDREPVVPWEGPAPAITTRETATPIRRATESWQRTPPLRELPLGVYTAATVRDTSTVKADAIVIGTGAGGAVAAALLAAAGKRVVMLEAGEFMRSDEFNENEGEMTTRLYAEGGLRATDDLAVSMVQGATVGGSTTINWMIMLRTPAHVLEEWATRFGLEGMRATDMAPVFDRIERDVHAARVPDDAHSPNNRIILDGAAKLGWRAESAMINARGCVRAGFCGQGCRYDAKQGTQQTYIPRALASGATLYANTHATAIRVAGRSNASPRGLATKQVTAIIAAPDGSSPARELSFEAPIVIVSGGAVETPLLLQRSGLGGGGVGRYLRLHPTSAVLGLHNREIYGAAGIPLSAMCDEFIQRDSNGYGFWLECPPLHPSIGSAAMPQFGEKHAAVFRQFPNLASTIALVRDGSDLEQSNGSVMLDAQQRPRIRYSLGPRDADNMRASLEAAARLQLATGAREVYTLHSRPIVIRNESDLAKIRTRPVNANRMAVFSAHVNGTCRIGTDPATSGVSPTGERHGVPGVYVFDGSMLPTGVGVNPQETIMAMTTVLTERLLANWP
jgi:choline dehydrogenase-like flavoprotein